MEMADEDRFTRRLLAKALAEVVHMDFENGGLRSRTVLAPGAKNKAYVFCVLQPLPDEDPDEYRKKRREFLSLKCLAAKCYMRDLEVVVGIGAEPRDGREHFSEDALFLDGQSWGEKEFQDALSELVKVKFLSVEGQTLKVVRATEYPEVGTDT